MEKIELLAQRIDSLIQELNRLRLENHQLREEGRTVRDDLELSRMEADELRGKLDLESSSRSEAVSRIDALLEKIQSAFPAPDEQPNG